MLLFLVLSFLEIRDERRQKSISVEFNFATVFVLKHCVCTTYLMIIYGKIYSLVKILRKYRAGHLLLKAVQNA
jgi:hypothetical protein